ncbi:hypothetical protein GCM10027282_10240 [Frigoribacterium salinisoli]
MSSVVLNDAFVSVERRLVREVLVLLVVVPGVLAMVGSSCRPGDGTAVRVHRPRSSSGGEERPMRADPLCIVGGCE